MKILALDSSAVSASAAVLDDDKVLGEFFINTKQTHSQTLMPMVQQVLTQTKTSLEEMDLFAVSAGPGSFTGVRIGVACVKGMAFAQNKPCIGVSTLESNGVSAFYVKRHYMRSDGCKMPASLSCFVSCERN